MNKCLIYGGGTFTHGKCHLALATPAFGTTARQLKTIFDQRAINYQNELILTKMADFSSRIVTNTDLYYNIIQAIKDPLVKVIIFNAAVCDFYLSNLPEEERLSSFDNYDNVQLVAETCKFIKIIKEKRPDIFVVGFKTTRNAHVDTQQFLAEKQIKDSGVDIVFANDLGTRVNLVVVKKGGNYIDERDKLLNLLPTLVFNGVKTGNNFEPFKCYR